MMALLERAARAPYSIWGLVLAGFIMTGLLGQIVLERISILASGTEIKLATQPVDPRDIFRGEYVILTYEISQLAINDLAGEADSFAEGDEIYVTVKEAASGLWEPLAIASGMPEPSAGHVALRGQIVSLYGEPTAPVQTRAGGTTQRPDREPCPDCRTARVVYGIESYFVPEGQGPELERIRDEGDVTIVAAVAENGTAAIKGIILDGGDPVYLEPLL